MPNIINQQKIIITFFLLTICSLTKAQLLYKKCTLIDSNLNQIIGKINYRDWLKNKNIIEFRDVNSKNKKEINPLEIKKIIFETEIFESGIIAIEHSPWEISTLTNDSSLNITYEHTFLKLLVDGEKKLYQYITPDWHEFYYIKKDTFFELLVQKKYLITTNGITTIREVTKYKNQLLEYLEKCESIFSEIEKLDYSNKRITALFNTYYNCTKTKITFRNKENNIKYKLGILTGASINTIKIAKKAPQNLKKITNNLGVEPSAGVFFDVIFPKQNQQWSIHNELLYIGYKSKDSFSENTSQKATVNIDYNAIKFISMLRYTYPILKVNFFVQYGFSYNQILKENNYINNYYIPLNQISHTPINHKYELRTIHGVGLSYNRFLLLLHRDKVNIDESYLLRRLNLLLLVSL